MPPKYVTRRPRSTWCEELDMDVPDPAPLTVYEPDDGAEPTGILDASGNELWRIEEREPIGFRVRE